MNLPTTARDLVYHLSETVTLSGPVVKATIIRVTFCDGPRIMESFPLIDQWSGMERRLQRAVDRYGGSN
jgi:hypothetical protein